MEQEQKLIRNSIELKTIYELYYSELCIKAAKILGNNQDAEDVVQEVIIEFWNKRSEISIENPRAYLYRSVYNRSLNLLKKNIKLNSEEIIEFENFPLESSIVETLEEKELHAKIEKAIQELPEKTRAVFVLSRFEDKTYKEIAEDLDISIKTVESQISAALKLLRKKILKV